MVFLVESIEGGDLALWVATRGYQLLINLVVSWSWSSWPGIRFHCAWLN